jgi:ABC-type transport system involved in multi-copper enzyme maturation permease subunit
MALTVIGGLFFLAIGSFSLFFSVLLGERGRAALISAGILTTMYLLTALGAYAKWSKSINKALLFHYYEPQKLLASGHIPLKSVLVYVGVAVAFYVGSILVFNRRDIAP